MPKAAPCAEPARLIKDAAEFIRYVPGRLVRPVFRVQVVGSRAPGTGPRRPARRCFVRVRLHGRVLYNGEGHLRSRLSSHKRSARSLSQPFAPEQDLHRQCCRSAVLSINGKCHLRAQPCNHVRAAASSVAVRFGRTSCSYRLRLSWTAFLARSGPKKSWTRTDLFSSFL